jgi:hypothetical protein
MTKSLQMSAEYRLPNVIPHFHLRERGIEMRISPQKTREIWGNLSVGLKKEGNLQSFRECTVLEKRDKKYALLFPLRFGGVVVSLPACLLILKSKTKKRIASERKRIIAWEKNCEKKKEENCKSAKEKSLYLRW